MKLIIAGGRDLIITTKQIREFINFFNLQPSIIVHGGATGIDSCGSNYANEWGLSSSVFLPEWDKHRKAAGPIRNKEMAESADALLLIWDGESKGSKNMKENMLKLNKPVYEVILRKYNER